jgi:hypothetical protein
VDVSVEGAEGFVVHDPAPGASQKRVTVERPGFDAVLVYTLPARGKKAA